MGIFFRPGCKDVHLKIRRKISKTMIHTHDVINFDINENGQMILNIIYFDHLFGISTPKYRCSLYSMSQNSIGRSGN